MQRRGTITKWNDEKGFGFVVPDDRTDDVFLHQRAMGGPSRRPKTGDRVRYQLGYDVKGRRQAQKVKLEAPFGGLRVLTNLLFPGLVLGAAWFASRAGWIPPWVALLYIAASAAAATACAVDKFRAQQGHWRISEGTLHLFELAGGWPGAFAAQRILRHKTRKLSFQLVFWIIVLAHLALWAWVAKRRMEGWN